MSYHSTAMRRRQSRNQSCVSRREMLNSACIGLPMSCTLKGLASVATAKEQATAKSDVPPHEWLAKIQSNLLAYERADCEGVRELNYMKQIVELPDEGHDKPHVCLGQAIVFRTLQILSRHWDDGVVRAGDFEKVETNWGGDAPREVFLGILKVEPARFIVPKHLGAKRMPGVVGEEGHYTFALKNGDIAKISVSKRLVPDAFLQMQVKRKIEGDKSQELKEKIEAMKEVIVRQLELPLEPRELFQIS